jgi:hypothetical protein
VGRLEFARDKEIDEAAQAKLARVIKDQRQAYDEGEASTIRRVQERLGAIQASGKFKELASPDKFVKMSLVFVPKETTAVLKAVTVRVAPLSLSPPPPPSSHPPSRTGRRRAN